MADPVPPYSLGSCNLCGAQQYTMSRRENHMTGCIRFERVHEPGPFREVPWPRRYERQW